MRIGKCYVAYCAFPIALTSGLPSAQAQEAGSAADIIQADFNGNRRYEGTYRGEISVVMDRDRRIGGTFRRAGTTRTIPVEGSFEISINYYRDGRVSGRIWSRPRTGDLKWPSSFDGTRRGSTCYLNMGGSQPYPTYCGLQRFGYNQTNYSLGGPATLDLSVIAQYREERNVAHGSAPASARMQPPTGKKYLDTSVARSNMSLDPDSLPIVNRDQLPPLSSYADRRYDVIVYRNGEWRLANPAFFNLRDMWDCRPNYNQTAWACQTGNKNGYHRAFVAQVNGHFSPVKHQLKEVNTWDILIGSLEYGIITSPVSSPASGTSYDEYERGCAARGLTPGAC